MMKARIIKNEDGYEAALMRIEQLMELQAPSDDELDDLELLSLLVEQYEDKAFPIDLPSPIAAIKFRMEQEGLTQANLVPYMGQKSRVSEVLAGKRQLSLAMIRKLHAELGIPAEVLLGSPGSKMLPESDIWPKFPVAEVLKKG